MAYTVGSVSVKVVPDFRGGQEKIRREVAGIKDAEVDVKPTIDKAAARKAGNEASSVLGEGIRQGITRASPMIVAGLAAGLTAGAPLLLAAGTTLFAGVALAGALGAKDVREEYINLGADIKNSVVSDTAALRPAFKALAGDLGSSFEAIRPQLREIFTDLNPQISVFGRGITDLAKNAMPGFVASVKAGMPVTQGLADLLGKLGTGVSGMFTNLATSSGASGKVLSELGSIFQSILPLVGQLLASGATLASSVLPGLSSAVGGVSSGLGVVLRFIGPILPLLGSIAGAILPVIAGFKAFSFLGAGLTGLGDKVKGISTNLAASGVAGGRAAAATGKFGSALGKVGSGLPIVGALLAGLAIGYEELRDKSDEFAKSAIDGSMSYQEALNAERNSIEKRNFWIGDTTPLLDNETEARRNLDTQIQSNLSKLGGEELARAQAALAQGKYNDAVAQYGINSLDAQAAGAALGAANSELARQHDIAARAAETQADAIARLNREAQAFANAQLGLAGAELAFDKQLKDTNETLRNHSAKSIEGREANLGLAQSAIQVATAAGEQAVANQGVAGTAREAEVRNAGYNARLLDLIATTPSVLSALSANGVSFDKLGLAASGATVQVDKTGGAVIRLPNGKEIKLSAQNVQALGGIGAVQSAVDRVPRTVTITFHGVVGASIAAATASVRNSAASAAAAARAAAGRATGGPIFGPGSGTSDTAGIFALSNGEHVLTAREVRAAGGHGAIYALRRELLSKGRGLAEGGPVSPSRLSTATAVAGGDTYVINPSAQLDEVRIARETSRIQQFNRRVAV